MILLLPEAKHVVEKQGRTKPFRAMRFAEDAAGREALELARLRFWNRKDITLGTEASDDALPVRVLHGLPEKQTENPALYAKQGYCMDIAQAELTVYYEHRAGLINALTSLKQLLTASDGGYTLPLCEITDYPSLETRAIAQTFSWYAGYGRLGFDSQLWGYEEWVEYLNICLDNKINQFNLVMYGYWPFDMPGYPETSLRDVPMKIWNAENRRWLTVRYTHPNLEEPFLDKFIALAHKLEVKIFAYVGLNSYNGAYSIKHPEARMKPPRKPGLPERFRFTLPQLSRYAGVYP